MVALASGIAVSALTAVPVELSAPGVAQYEADSVPAGAGGGLSRLARRVGPRLLAAAEQIALRLGQTAREDER
jgi:hypothetical protein